MVRISILGNSDTTGQRLAAGDSPWPELVKDQLSARLGENVTVDSWKFAAYRPGAVDYALHLVDEAEPDVVIVTLASYWCAFSTVQTGIEQRYGQRAARLYTRTERTFARQFERPGMAATRKRLARRVTRKIVGTGTLLSVEAFLDIYSSLIRELAKRENLQVVVLGDHHFTAEIRKTMPAISPAVARIESAIRPIVTERLLVWGDLEQAIAGARREELIMSDGVHMTAEAHRRVAEALVPVLEAVVRA